VVKRGPTAGVQQTKGESRVLHALNRLTFGPRPGDVATVQAMGLSTWFEMQLNPSKIDDSALNARLAMFPAMQLPQAQLMARYPSQQIIRAMAQRNMWLPSDPVERAIYGDQMAFYKMQQANKAGKDAAAAAAATAGNADNSMAGDTMAAGTAPAGAGTAPGRKAGKKAAQAEQGAIAAGMGTTAAGTAGGGMAAETPNSEAMAGEAGNGATSNATAVLPKADIADTGQAPNQHVESLFKDIEAVKIINLPPEERMRKVIAMAPADFVGFRQSLSGGEVAQFTQGLNPQQREIFAAMQNSTRMIGAEEMQARLIRDIYSERQLEAVIDRLLAEPLQRVCAEEPERALSDSLV
jgi:hypothetical protein